MGGVRGGGGAGADTFAMSEIRPKTASGSRIISQTAEQQRVLKDLDKFDIMAADRRPRRSDYADPPIPLPRKVATLKPIKVPSNRNYWQECKVSI